MVSILLAIGRRIDPTCHCVGLFVPPRFIDSSIFFGSFSHMKFFFDISFSLNSLPKINSTMTPTDGSCPTRRSITPTCVASWNFSAASQWSLTVAAEPLLSLSRSFLTFGPMTFNVSWVLFPSAIPTTAFILQPTTVPSTVGLLPWKLPSGPSPTTCPTVQYHGVTIRAILHALHLSTILSRR